MLKESEFRKIIRESIKETIKEATTASDSPGPKGYAAFLKGEDLESYLKDLEQSLKSNTGYTMVNESFTKKDWDVKWKLPKDSLSNSDYEIDLKIVTDRRTKALQPLLKSKPELRAFAPRTLYTMSYDELMQLYNGLKEGSVNEDAIPYAVGFPIVRKFADRLSFGRGMKRDGNTFFVVANMKIDNAAIKKELQRHYEIRRIDRGSRGSNEYYVYDKDSGYVMLVQPSKKDNWLQISPFTTIDDWKQYESVNEAKKSKYHTIVVYNGTRLAVDNADIPRLKSGKDVVGKSVKYAGQEEWILAKGKWKIEESVNEVNLGAKLLKNLKDPNFIPALDAADRDILVAALEMGKFNTKNKSTVKDVAKLLKNLKDPNFIPQLDNVDRDSLILALKSAIKNESVNESKYTVQYWMMTRDDDYDMYDDTVDAKSEKEAIAKVKKIARRGKNFKVINIEESVNKTDSAMHAYTLHRLANNVGQMAASNFLSKHNVNLKLLAKALQQKTIDKYTLRDIVNGTADKSKMRSFIGKFVNESVNEGKDEVYLKTLADSDYFAKGYETLFGLQSSIKRILGDREISPDESDVLDAINWLKDGLGNGDPRKTSLGKKLLKMKWVTESVNEGIFKDKRDLVGYEVDSFIGNYKKINPKNTVKLGGDGFVYGFRKGDKDGHWKLDKDSGKIYSDSNAEVGNLIHRTSGAKLWK